MVVEVRWPSIGRTPISTPDVQPVFDFLDEATAADWASGSGTLGLRRAGMTLIVSRKPGFGYMVSWLGRGKSTPGDVLVRNHDWSQTTSVLVGGEPWNVPTAFFVDDAETKRAIAHFFATGDKAPDLEWVDAGQAMTAAGL